MKRLLCAILLAATVSGCDRSPTTPDQPVTTFSGVWGGVARVVYCRADDFRTCSRTAFIQDIQLQFTQMTDAVTGEVWLGDSRSPLKFEVSGQIGESKKLSLTGAVSRPPNSHSDLIVSWDSQLVSDGYGMEGTFATWNNGGIGGMTRDLRFELSNIRRRAVPR